MSSKRLTIALGLLLFLPATAGAQSLFSGGGLGLLSDPVDARSRALGSTGVGTSGWHLLPTDPAAAAGLVLPTVSASAQPVNLQIEGGADAGGTRFPGFGVAYPFGRHIISVQFGSFLEQGWRVRTERTIGMPGAPDGSPSVTTRDLYEASGGVGQFRLGWATRIGSSVAVGVNAGSYSGGVERRFLRELNPAEVGPDVEPFRTAGRWRASGPVVSAGVIWDPSVLYRVTGAVDWSGDLRLDPVAPTPGGVREYSMPLTVRLGGEFVLTPGLALHTGLSRADWSDTDRDLGGDAARGVAWGYGGGLELAGPSIRGRGLPLRVGVRHQDLPFHFDGAETRERSFSFGLGSNLSIAEAMPVARFDIGLERGDRDAGPLSESFWRTTISLRVAGG